MPKIKWRRPPEAGVLELLEKHVSLCVLASDDLVQATELKTTGNETEARNALEKLFNAERAADELRRKMAEELAKGILPPLSREDLMRVVRRLDLVTDWLKDGGRVLAILPTNELPENFKKLLFELAKKLRECVHVLGHSIRTVYEDYKKALDECYEVEKIEREIDHMYMGILDKMKHFDVKNQTSLLLMEFLRSLESAADECENTADFLRIMIVSTFH